MLTLDPQTVREFAQEVRRLAEDVCAVESIQNLYRAVQDALDLRKPVCNVSGRCCRFEEYGHRLFVTTLEMAAFVHHLGQQHSVDGWNGRGCPFQWNGLCKVHRIRPMGCRLYFCDPTAIEWHQETYERFHAELRRLHEVANARYFYVEWRTALRSMEVIPHLVPVQIPTE